VGPQEAAGLVCAAVRELFEECGVLLAGTSASDVVADLSGPEWEADRLALLAHEVALSEVLQRRRLMLRSDLLGAWSRWCTPAFEPRRYDTWFFIAALPAGQQARDVGGEADHASWIPVADAARCGQTGELAMMPPTVITLDELADAADVGAALARPRTLSLVMPWLVCQGDEVSIRVDVDGVGGGLPGPASGLLEQP
jgi:hypothetical protein